MTKNNDDATTPEDKAVYQRAGKRTTNALAGQSIPIPPLFILMTRNAAAAVILRQSIYLTTSSEADSDGWFCVPYETWETDYGLTKDIIRGAINGGKKTTGLLQLGLETDVRKERRGNWQSSAPKNHYRINFDKLELAITEFESGKFRQSEKQTKQDSGKSRPSTYSKKKEKNPAPNGSGKGLAARAYKFAVILGRYRLEGLEPKPEQINILIGKNSKGVAGQLARDKDLAHLTDEDLQKFLSDWTSENPDAKRLGALDTIRRNWIEWAALQTPSDPRASQKWQANAELYDAFAAAFSDRWNDTEILAQDFSGIEAWWYHTGQYEQGDGE